MVSIRERILSQVSSYWSLLADETQDCSSAEQVSVCVRYVDASCDVNVGFVKLEKMDAQSIGLPQFRVGDWTCRNWLHRGMMVQM